MGNADDKREGDDIQQEKRAVIENDDLYKRIDEEHSSPYCSQQGEDLDPVQSKRFVPHNLSGNNHSFLLSIS